MVWEDIFRVDKCFVENLVWFHATLVLGMKDKTHEINHHFSKITRLDMSFKQVEWQMFMVSSFDPGLNLFFS